MTAVSETVLPRARPLVGVVLLALATLAFALADSVTKQQAMKNPVSVVVAVRYLVNLALLSALLGPSLGARLWRTERQGLVFARSLCLALASLSMGYALRVMPVGEAIAIVYLAPLLVMLLALPVLGERVGAVGWIGATAGFAGVLLIARPGGGLDPLGVAFALFNAVVSTGYHLLTRFLTRTETTVAMLYQSALVGSVIFCLMALGSLDGLSVTPVDIAMMSVIGALMTLGHFLFTAAYREAPASLLAPINYLHLFWAGGFGWLMFGHVPDSYALAGMALISAAGALVGLWSAWRTASSVRPAPRG